MSKPRTKAGRDLLGLVDLRAAADPSGRVSVSVEFLRDRVLAIEAAPAPLDGLREAAQRIVDAPKTVQYVEGTGLWNDIAALEIALREGETP